MARADLRPPASTFWHHSSSLFGVDHAPDRFSGCECGAFSDRAREDDAIDVYVRPHLQVGPPARRGQVGEAVLWRTPSRALTGSRPAPTTLGSL
jgi:hypothetical protein